MRRPNFRGAGADLASAAIAFAAGLMGAPLWAAALVALAAAGVWYWLRHDALSRMAPGLRRRSP